MKSIDTEILHHYQNASAYEWFETDGMGGVATCSLSGANTRKQHGLLSVVEDDGRRTILVSTLQETITDADRLYELSTNAYCGAIHPHGYENIESFTLEPWPTWRYRFATCVVEKQFFLVHGEHTAVVIYDLSEAEHPVKLVVRPLLAFRNQNDIRRETPGFSPAWQVTWEFVECRAPGEGHAVFIAHPNAHVESIPLWYREFVYERDRESHLDCIEDLFHPGYIELTLATGQPRALVLSWPSPRPVSTVRHYLQQERDRRTALHRMSGVKRDAFFQCLLAGSEAFLYEKSDGTLGIYAGLPWTESDFASGCIAMPGLLLVRQRFDDARRFLRGAFESVLGEQDADISGAALWLFIASWRFWKAAQDEAFVRELIAPGLRAVAERYMNSKSCRLDDDGMLEVIAGDVPVKQLGLCALWYNAQRILVELSKAAGTARADIWTTRAELTYENFARVFGLDESPLLAAAVSKAGCDRTFSIGQALAFGLPFSCLPNPAPLANLIKQELWTPYGLRTLSKVDSRYRGDASDVKRIPKQWRGSINPGYFGLGYDALLRAGIALANPETFIPLEEELRRSGLGHISGAFTGDAPHTPCDYVASASALGEVLRIYARDVMQLPHVV